MTATATKRKTRVGGMTCEARALAAALRTVSAAVPTRSPKPILQNVLISDGVVSATDLELKITAPLPESSGHNFLLPHARLLTIVGLLHADDEVTIAADGGLATVRGGNGEWKIPVEDVAEYPFPACGVSDAIARLPGDQLASLMQAVRFATDTDSSRFALGAVLIEFKDGTLTFVGTDGRRLCIASCDIDQATDDRDVLAPRRAIDVLVKLARSADAVQLSVNASELVADVDGVIVQARMVEGRFPRWRDADKAHDATPSMVQAEALLAAVEQAAICTDEQSQAVTLTVSDDGLHVHGKSSAYGEAATTCDLVEVGHKVSTRLNPRFVREWLSCGSIDPAEAVTLTIADKASAVVLSVGENTRTVIMPMEDA